MRHNKREEIKNFSELTKHLLSAFWKLLKFGDPPTIHSIKCRLEEYTKM
jgi:hypothetical protein